MADTLHIHGHPLSQPARSVSIFCAFSGVANEYHVIDLAHGENHSEAFRKINPYETVPVIQHGDYNLWESAAIIPYIADAFNVDNQWYPKDIKIRGKINAYLHSHHQGCREPVCGYLVATFIGPKFYGRPEATPEVEAALKVKFEEYFETLKWTISETGFVARTQEATIADVFAYSEIAETLMIGYDLSKFPEVLAWFNRIGENPIVSQAHETLRTFCAGLASQAAPQ